MQHILSMILGIRYRECDVRRTVWCQHCVTLTAGGCGHDPTVETDDDREHNESVLLLGGFALDQVSNVEVVTSSPHSCHHHHLQDMTVPRPRSVAGVIGEQSVMVCGGRTGTGHRSCSHLNISSGHWSPGDTMTEDREDAAAAVINDQVEDICRM